MKMPLAKRFKIGHTFECENSKLNFFVHFSPKMNAQHTFIIAKYRVEQKTI